MKTYTFWYETDGPASVKVYFHGLRPTQAKYRYDCARKYMFYMGKSLRACGWEAEAE